MMIHLGIERALGKRLLQSIEQSTLIEGCCSITPSQQLIK
jgi:hypothetical protein